MSSLTRHSSMNSSDIAGIGFIDYKSKFSIFSLILLSST